MELDRHLVGTLDKVAPTAWKGQVYRHHAPRYAVLDGLGAREHGGRWNPPHSFPVVYTATDRGTVDAEFVRLARRSGMAPAALLPRRLSTVSVDLHRVLDLTSASVRRRLGVTREMLRDEDPTLTRSIGQAAQFLGFEAILAPGAAGGTVLAIFAADLAPDSRVERVADEVYSPPGINA